MNQPARIIYEDLVKDYWESLTTTLRGFRPAADFLDMWVPDEDNLKSIVNLVEAAQMAGKDAISISIGPDTLQNLELTKLLDLSADYGKVHVESQEQGAVLEVSHMVEWASLQRIHPAYRNGIQAALGSCSHQGTLTDEPSKLRVEGNYKGANLEVLVNPSEHLIEKVAYQADSLVQKAILETLSEIIVGMTVQEASDHAGIYLENRLRDRSEKLPVAGILTPKSADPIFDLPVKLTRDLLAKYREVTKYNATENRYVRQPSPEWLALSPEEKISRLEKAISEFCADSAIPKSALEIISLDYDIKLTIQFASEVPVAAKPKYMRQLEGALKEKVEAKIQLYMAEKKDLNKIRRLA